MNILRSFLLWVIGSLSLWSQSDDLNKTAPFQAVKWQARQPVVLVQNQWLPLVAIDGTKTEEIVQFCRTQFPFKWKKRFSEDLVPVLGAMGKARHNSRARTVCTYQCIEYRKGLVQFQRVPQLNERA